jgi:opacity protein-like surface antigen
MKATALATLLTGVALPAALGQGQATGKTLLTLSTFGGATGIDAGLANGHNASITAGADVGVHLFSSFLPSAELRASYPFYRGQTASAKNILGGLKVEKHYLHRFNPYTDLLYGRSIVDYAHGGYPNPSRTYLFTSNPSNVLSLGGGLDLDLTYHFAVKADAQFERYSTPVTASGNLYSEAVTLGVVYRFRITRVYVPR